jgi:hypothetical protein
MTTHSIFAPSSAERSVPCPASVTLEQRYPEAQADPAAAEGEAAHWALAEMLAGRPAPLGARAPNGMFLTDEMIDGAIVMAEDIEVVLTPFGMKPSDGAIEVSVDIPRVHELCHGTPDYRAWLPTAPRWTLLLYDFKFGHRIVEVFENPQLMRYVAGVISQTKLLDLDVDVICRIVQPRAFHRDGPIREWRFNAADIRAHINIHHAAAIEALSPNPRAIPGPWCRDCRARHACPTLQRAGYAAMDEAGRALPLELTPAAMGTELAMLNAAIERLEARKSGLEGQVEATIRSGGLVPGWALEYGRGRERWRIPDDQVIQIGRMLDVDVAKPAAALTPKQASAAGLPVEALRDLVETPRSGAKLVPDNGSTARRVFG